jgi:uncharacterized protein (TIGR02284 family)
MTNEETIGTLNNLIETCKDGQNGFKEAAEAVEKSDLKTFLYDCSQQRSQFAGELQTLVREMGGDPEDSGSISASLHRGWMNIKSAITGNNEQAILNECERGEDSAVKNYKEALDTELPTHVNSLVRKQFATVQTTHDKIKSLRDLAKAATN